MPLPTRRLAGALAAGCAATLVLPIAASAQEADPDVVAEREAAAAVKLPPGYQNPPEPTEDGKWERDPRFAGRRALRGSSNAAGHISVAAWDTIKNDSPGVLTTTLRVWGNATAWREGAFPLVLTSQFTCTGIGISGLGVGGGSVSVSGGASSSTLTWTSQREAESLSQAYVEDGHFHCKASNLSPARFTRRAVGEASYKKGDTRAEGSYAITW